MVHRGSLDWFLVEQSREARRTGTQGAVRRIPKLLRSAPDAAGPLGRNRVPLRGGTTARRSHESTLTSLRRDVRRDAAQSGWRSSAPGHSLEIWLQKHQVARQNQVSVENATDHLESLCAQRIRL